MKILWLLVLIACLVESRAQAPSSWKQITDKQLLKKGDDSAVLLGVWESPDGAQKVWLREGGSTPQLDFLLGLSELAGNNAADPSVLPVSVMALKEPLLGLRVTFEKGAHEAGFHSERLLILSEKKAFLIIAHTKQKSSFNAVGWELGKALPDPLGERRQQLEEGAIGINEMIAEGKKIQIDPSILPPIHDGKPLSGGPKILVSIGTGGAYSIDGITHDDDSLAEAFSKAKLENPKVILQISGPQDLVFKHCRKAIRLAAKEGINEVIFGGVQKDE